MLVHVWLSNHLVPGTRTTIFILALLALHLGNTGILLAEVPDVGNIEDQARNAFIDRFTKFTQDKNVMGKAATPNGAKVGGGRKTRFDADGSGMLPFQSDLTYHPKVFNTAEQLGEGKNAKNRTLFAFVSDHGKLTGAGGSSVLERTVYELHDKFSKEEDDPKNNKDDDKTGVKFRSVFKIETQEVFNKKDGGNQGGQGGQGGQGQNNKKEEAEKVERVTLRPEAKTKIEEVGEASFDTMKRAARDQGFEDDENTMPNLTFLYEGAKRATEALWAEAQARLGQRRINRGIRAGQLEKPQLDEGTPDCDAWATQINQEIAKAAAKGDQNVAKNLRQELNRINQQCKQMAGTNWKVINPRFEQAEAKNGKEGQDEFKTGDLNKEDGIQRDYRVGLELMDKAGKRAVDVPSNWRYTQQDDQFKLNTYDDKGNATGVRNVTVRDQLESYNAQLAEAAKGYEEVQKRLPDFKAPNPVDYAIQPGTESMIGARLNRPTESQMEEFGEAALAPSKLPQNYEQVLKASGGQ